MDINDVLTEPEKLVRLELKNAGFDIDKIRLLPRIYRKTRRDGGQNPFFRFHQDTLA